MPVPVIVLIIIAALLAIVGIVVCASRKVIDKKAPKFNTIGKVLYWTPGKLKFFGRVCVQYQKKGKPYQAMSSLMRVNKKPKDGSTHEWTIYTYSLPNKPTVMMAKPRKKEGE